MYSFLVLIDNISDPSLYLVAKEADSKLHVQGLLDNVKMLLSPF